MADADLRDPFIAVAEEAEKKIDHLLSSLTDEELADLNFLFTPRRQLSNGEWVEGRLHEVPFHFWGLAPKVRAHITVERRRREAAEKETTPA